MNDLEHKMNELKSEIASLPLGYISNKVINGKPKKYLQWQQDGKKSASTYRTKMQ